MESFVTSRTYKTETTYNYTVSSNCNLCFCLQEKSPDFRMEYITWPSLSIMAQAKTKDFFKRARPGAKAFDLTLYTLDGDAVKLLDRARPGRPLVINVGSCS